MTEVTCRVATEEDLSAIVVLWLELMDFHKDAVPFPLVHNAAELCRDHTRERMTRDDCLVLVAEGEGGVIGYSRAGIVHYPPVFDAPPYGLINELVVGSQSRRQGVGEQLYARTKEWLLSQGIERIEVGTATANPVSNAFWEKMGFQTYRETKLLVL